MDHDHVVLTVYPCGCVYASEPVKSSVARSLLAGGLESLPVSEIQVFEFRCRAAARLMEAGP